MKVEMIRSSRGKPKEEKRPKKNTVQSRSTALVQTNAPEQVRI